MILSLEGGYGFSSMVIFLQPAPFLLVCVPNILFKSTFHNYSVHLFFCWLSALCSQAEARRHIYYMQNNKTIVIISRHGDSHRNDIQDLELPPFLPLSLPFLAFPALYCPFQSLGGWVDAKEDIRQMERTRQCELPCTKAK